MLRQTDLKEDFSVFQDSKYQMVWVTIQCDKKGQKVKVCERKSPPRGHCSNSIKENGSLDNFCRG